ncbi:helix-turn-helix transcriptional regulator [Trabulsiella odontotermitis]|uniref:helix-turn-helix transcriptional regulator n=1 Tax=Trabulsiella odontotermitis TaxID=379893 RepID=UPI000675CF89|nr:hypothetical protein [Trabulsiella odontotermitis]KNC90527.1 hypothetical protein GM30_03230 [Trabulsiella odontotermitis]
MREDIKKEMHCVSCDISCLISPEKTVRSQYCGNILFSVWPETNIYFKNGVVGSFLLKYQNYLSNGFVFVDFSLPNIRCFMGSAWIDFLASTKMHIVIVADKKMAPLANYWLQNRQEIRGVIYSIDGDEVIDYKIKKLFKGDFTNRKVGEKLNRQEYSLLTHIIEGKSLKEIIEIEKVKPREIYVRKLRLEKKIGCRTKFILSQIIGSSAMHLGQ